MPKPTAKPTAPDAPLLTAGQRAKAIVLGLLVGTLYVIAIPDATTAAGVIVGSLAGIAYAFVIGAIAALRAPTTPEA